MYNWRLSSLVGGFLNNISSQAEVAPASGIPRACPTANPARNTECIICRNDFGDVDLPARSPTSNCKHPPKVCIECLQRGIFEAAKSGQYTSGIVCPSDGCSETLSHHDVQMWATREDFERYDNLMAKDCLKRAGLYVVCLNSKCGAGQVHSGGEDYNIVTCHACGAKQCYRHLVQWHAGVTCEQWEEYQRNLRNQDERDTEEWMLNGAKRCPGRDCGNRIQKGGGCDVMICKPPVGCGHKFCWQCLAPWNLIEGNDNSMHYDHCHYYSGLPGRNPAPPELGTRSPPCPSLRPNVYPANARRRNPAINSESRAPRRRLEDGPFAEPRRWDRRKSLERLRAEWEASDEARSVPGPGPRTHR